MQHNQNQALFETLFKRNFSDPGNKAFLEELTASHPYFSPAQFYLLQQTAEGTTAFEEQAARTNIFFNNPLWLNFQLQQTKQQIIPEAKPFAEPVPEIPLTENIIEPVTETIPEPVKEELAVIENITEIDTEPLPEIALTENIIEPVIETIPEPVEEELPVLENITDTESEAVPEIPLNENIIEPVIETIPEPVKEELPEIENITDTKSEAIPGIPLAENTIEPGIETMPEPELKMEPEPEPLKIELKLPEEKPITDDLPLFEPMHMVDYFASQGIKLSEEVQAGDKLGKQLKSFTEWLKTMKKVHTVAASDESIKQDLSVEALAEMSNTENEVITEAMAEVFARQGKTGRAMEVYQKLSLLNPAKSAYFAAKIENLKGA